MKRQVSLKTYFGTVLALLIITFASVSFVRSAGEITIESHSFIKGYTYIVEKDGATFKAFNGLTGALAKEDASDDTVIQYAIDQTTSNGGSIFVKSATYTASVTLKDNVTLALEQGATGITVSIDSGATCYLWDYNIGRIRYFVDGVAKTDFDLASGTITTLVWNDSWNSTVEDVVENFASLGWKAVWNSTVEAIVDAYNIAWNDNWNATVEELILENLIWQGDWNSTVVELIQNNQDFSWQGAWNATVEALVDTYEIAWKDSWNSTVEDIVLDYIFTNLKFTGEFWYGSSNRTDTIVYPESEASFVVFKDGSVYKAKNQSTGQIDYQSTNASYVAVSMVSDMSDGQSAFFKSATYDFSTLETYIDTTGKDITFIGENWEHTVFLDSRTGATRTISSTADTTPSGNITIRNIKFDRSVPSDLTVKYCVYGSWHTARIEHCKFIGNPTIANSETHHFLSVPFSGNIAIDATKNVYFIDNYVVDFQYGCVPVLCEFSLQTGNYIENSQTWALGAETSDIDYGTYTITDNTLINCAWYDEGISIDSANAATASETNSLIANNNIYNDASKHGCSPINVVTCCGVHVIGNTITQLGNDDSTWNGGIRVDNRDYTQIRDVVIAENHITTYGRRGIVVMGLYDGIIRDNTVKYGHQTGESHGIYVSIGDSLAWNSGTIEIRGNTVELNGTSVLRYGILINQPSGTGGTIDIIMRSNTITAYQGIRTDVDAVVQPIIYNDNIIDATYIVVDAGSVTTLHYENSGTSEASNDDWIAHGLVGDPSHNVWLTVEETDANYVIQLKATNATHFQIYLYDLTASALEDVDKTINWKAEVP